MKAAQIVAGSVMTGLILALAGALSHAQRSNERAPTKLDNEPAGRSNQPSGPKPKAPQPAPERVALPGVIQGPTDGVVVSNPGAMLAVSRFYRLLQDPKLKATDVLGSKFMLDGRDVIPADKQQAFIDKAREGSLREKGTNTLLGLTFLPAGNTWDEAQRWLAPIATGERAKALFDHAKKQKGSLVRILLARAKPGKPVSYEYALIAIDNPESEETARVTGFMD